MSRLPATYSIGFVREDGDFQLLATLNNNDALISDVDFQALVHNVRDAIRDVLPDEKVITLIRQDAPDYVDLED